MTRIGRIAFVLSGLALITALDIAPAFARGGGAPWMNSPGYQRRLQESHAALSNRPLVQPRWNTHRKRR